MQTGELIASKKSMWFLFQQKSDNSFAYGSIDTVILKSVNPPYKKTHLFSRLLLGSHLVFLRLEEELC